MQICLLAVGDRMPGWIQAGFDEYAKRMPPHVRLVLREVRPANRTKGANIARAVDEEGKRLWAAVPKGAYVVALDRQGRELDTETLAAEIGTRMARGGDLAFLVGGPDGLSEASLVRADARWSLSRLTLAHPLVRVVFAEQIYRAWSILGNLPYHR